MEELTPATSMKYLKRMGISTLNENDENLALALGGLDKGISPLEMAGAYATIANDGIYIEPTFYIKITLNNGEDVLKTSQKSRQVFSKDVAYVVKDLLTQPVEGENGTATYCSISGMDVAAKTGTTNEDYDRWLCGFTNYYTAVTWFGYDLSEPIRYNGKNPAGLIWANVMTRIHTNLKNSSFEIPSNVISQKICKKSLKVANDDCTETFTEYFINGTVPEICNEH
jgi:penicillin-binding protein 1A